MHRRRTATRVPGAARRIRPRLRRRFGQPTAVLLAIVCLLLVSAGLVLSRGKTSQPQPVHGADPRPASDVGGSQGESTGGNPEGRPAAATPPDRSAPLPDPVALAGALRGPLTSPAFTGPAQLQVRDLQTGALLFGRFDQVPEAPASTAKLLTAAVVLTELGPQARLTTKVYADRNVLYLVGGGDPTLTRNRPAHASPAPATVEDLANQIRAAGVRSAAAVVGDAGLFTGPPLAAGWRPGYLNSEIGAVSALTLDEGRRGDPVRVATTALQQALGAKGIRVPAVRPGQAPPGARLIASVSSPPVSALVERMLAFSDNGLAEALGRLVANHDGRPADFSGTASALLDGARSLGLPVDGVRLFDASGLSHDDRVPPEVLVDVLRLAAAAEHPELRAIIAGLPVAGRSGTLLARFHTADTRAGAGIVRAKSGRLAGIVALAGLVPDADGRVMVFAARAPAANAAAGEQALDRLATTLVGCGCRAPAGPGTGGT